jgi:hypothetical protein
MMTMAANPAANGATPDICDNVEFTIGPDDVTPEITAQLEADQKRQLAAGRRLMLQEKLEAEQARRAKARQTS